MAARRFSWERLAPWLRRWTPSSRGSNSSGLNHPSAAVHAPPGTRQFSRGQALGTGDPGHLFPQSRCRLDRNVPPSRHRAMW